MTDCTLFRFCCDWWDKILHGPEETLVVFSFGFYHGVFASLLLLLLLLLISYLLFKRVRYCKVIVRKMPRGTLEISAHAVSDLIRSLESEFDYLEIGKVFLIHARGGKQILEIHVNYQPSGSARPLHEIAEALQDRALEELRNSFGIDTAEHVSVKAGRAKPLKSAF